MLLPVPIGAPPHSPLNHWATAFVPRVPSVTVKVMLPPLQMVASVKKIGAIDGVLTLINWEAQAVALQVPLYLTKYVVLLEGETVMLLPVPITVPLHELADHSAMAPVPALPPTSVKVVLLP